MDLDFDMKRNRAGSVTKMLYEYDTHVHISTYILLGFFCLLDGLSLGSGIGWLDGYLASERRIDIEIFLARVFSQGIEM